MNGFDETIKAVKAGKKARRDSWKEGEFIFLVPGSNFKVNRAPLLGIYPEGTEIKYHAHIDIRYTDGIIEPWTASQSDMLENNWEIIDGN